MTALIFVLALLAGARTYDLLVYDDITVGLRDWLFNRKFMWDDLGEPTFWNAGWECPFCWGFWITAGWVLTGTFWGDTIAWQIAAGAFAANYVQGFLNGRLYRG